MVGKAAKPDRVGELERRLAEVEERLRRAEAALAKGGPSSPADLPNQGWVVVRGKAARETRGTPATDAGWAPPSASASPVPPVPYSALPEAGATAPPAPATSAAPAQNRRSFEWLLGGNWLARIGVLILALGVLFFLKLSFDNNWIPLLGRAGIGVVGGLLLFATGELLRRRGFDSVYCQVLAGGGAIIAYATVYAAYVLPHYRAALGITLPVEVVLLAVVSALLGAYAVWRDLPVLAGVAIGLTALLVAPAGDFSSVGLLFVGLMGSALLLAAAWRGWSNVVLTSVLALNAAHLAAAIADDVPWALTLASAVVVNGLAVLAAARSRDPRPELPRIESGLASIGLFVVAAVALQRADVTHPLGWSLLAVGLASVATCLAAPRLAPALGATGAVLLLLWPFAHFPGLLASAGAHLALAGAATLVSLVLRRGTRWIRLVGTSAVGLAAFTLVARGSLSGLADREPWLAGGLAALAALLAATLWVLERRRVAAAVTAEATGLRGPDAAIVPFAVLAFVLLAWPLVQFTGLVEAAAFAALAVLLLVASAWAGGRPWMRGLAVSVLLFGAFILWGHAQGDSPALDAQPLAGGVIALAFLALAATAWRLETGAADGAPGGAKGSPAGWGALGTAVALTVLWPFVQFRLDVAQALLHAGLALLAWGATFVLPAERRTLLPWSAGLALVGTVGLLRLGVQHQIDAQPLAAAAATALLALAAAAVWATARRPSPEGAASPADGLARITALGVVAAAPLIGLAFLLSGWGITVSWATLAFGLVAAGLALRALEVRYAALATFGLVIGRIFLVDLSTLSLPARVVAFILTGALLLLAAYLFARQRKAETAAAPPSPPVGPG